LERKAVASKSGLDPQSWTEAQIPHQIGRQAVVTGAAEGIGYACAVALAKAGADVIVAASCESEGRHAVAAIRPQARAALVRFEKLDPTSLDSVREFAARLAAQDRGVDLLINAGAGRGSHSRLDGNGRSLTAEGFELEFGAGYLAHYALTAQLLPLLRKGRKPRVVQLSSLVQSEAAIQFDDLQMERSFGPAQAYAQAKLALLMFARELQGRSDAAGWGVVSLAAHPGYLDSEPYPDGFGEPGLVPRFQRGLRALVKRSPEEAAQAVLFAATTPIVQKGGFYGPTGAMELSGPPGEARMGAGARDERAARRLWEISEKLTGVHWPE
jgi:NAD(P)-dependent dehydrogenase (short-subunit alcohol dehydrogenase family)